MTSTPPQTEFYHDVLVFHDTKASSAVVDRWYGEMLPATRAFFPLAHLTMEFSVSHYSRHYFKNLRGFRLNVTLVDKSIDSCL